MQVGLAGSAHRAGVAAKSEIQVWGPNSYKDGAAVLEMGKAVGEAVGGGEVKVDREF